MSEFVDECRREWRRLGVPEPIGNEMAADLTADLEEAEAEGGSPEDVLGSSAFDPRGFAAAWAVARGVARADVPPPRSSGRSRLVVVAAATAGALAALALIVGHGARSVAVAAPGPGVFRRFPVGVGRVVGLHVLPAVALVVAGGLMVGGAVVVVTAAHRAASAHWGRGRRHGGGPSPGW